MLALMSTLELISCSLSRVIVGHASLPLQWNCISLDWTPSQYWYEIALSAWNCLVYISLLRKPLKILASAVMPMIIAEQVWLGPGLCLVSCGQWWDMCSECEFIGVKYAKIKDWSNCSNCCPILNVAMILCHLWTASVFLCFGRDRACDFQTLPGVFKWLTNAVVMGAARPFHQVDWWHLLCSPETQTQMLVSCCARTILEGLAG